MRLQFFQRLTRVYNCLHLQRWLSRTPGIYDDDMAEAAPDVISTTSKTLADSESKSLPPKTLSTTPTAVVAPSAEAAGCRIKGRNVSFSPTPAEIDDSLASPTSPPPSIVRREASATGSIESSDESRKSTSSADESDSAASDATSHSTSDAAAVRMRKCFWTRYLSAVDRYLGDMKTSIDVRFRMREVL